AAVAAQRYAASGAGPAERAEALHALLSLIHALDWLDLHDGEDRAAVAAFFAGEFGDPVPIALAGAEPSAQEKGGRRFAAILARARQLIAEERFLHWQVAFPGVWT